MPSRFWKASGNALLPGSNVLAVSTVWTPASLPGLLVWAENDPATIFSDAGSTLAVAGSDTVQQWNDKSGNSNHLKQATSGNRPAYATASGHGYLQFTIANSNWLETAASIAAGDGSGQNYIAIFGLIDTIAASNGLARVQSGLNTFSGSGDSWLINSGGGSEFGPVVTTATMLSIIGVTLSSTVEVFMNNTTDGSSSATPSTTTAVLQVGRASTGFGSFKCRGIVYGTGALSSTDRGLLHTYGAAL